MAMISNMVHAPHASPVHHAQSQLESLADEEADKLARGIDDGPELISSSDVTRQELTASMKQQRRASSSTTSSLSRMSSRPSYEQIALGHGHASSSASTSGSAPASASGSGSSTPSGSGNGISVAAIGKVNVTDPWGTAWGMDSPYDNALAYSSNPNRLTIRQSAYYGSNITLAALAAAEAGNSANATALGLSGPNLNLHPYPLSNISSSASGGSSSNSSSGITSATANTNNNNVWSEASSLSSINSMPPSAPWMGNSPPPASSSASSTSPTDRHGKRRSVSFQGDLATLMQQQQQQNPQYNAGRLSPSAVSMHEYRHQHRYNHHHHRPHSQPHHAVTTETGMRTRSTTHLPSMLRQGHVNGYSNNGNHNNNMPPNRRTTSTPGTQADRSNFRKSFIGGSVINQSHAASDLPPVPVDPKVLAKQNKRVSKHPGSNATNNNDKSDTLSVLSATDSTRSGIGSINTSGKGSRRKSWFSRSPSSLSVESPSPSSATFPSTSSSTSTSTSRTSLSNIRRGSSGGGNGGGNGGGGGDSSSSSRPSPILSRSPHSFGTEPPPPTPPLPDTLPVPSSLGDRGRKASTTSLQQARINGSGASTPSSIGNIELPPVNVTGAADNVNAAALTPSQRTIANENQQSQTSSPSLVATSTAAGIALPETPHGARHQQKGSSTPSTIYGTPLASPTHAPSSSSSTITYGLPMPPTSSPLSMSPMTSPTSASTMPLKPAASARSSAMQLHTHEEQPMLPEMSPSPHMHIQNMQAASDAYNQKHGNIGIGNYPGSSNSNSNSSGMVRSASDNANIGAFGRMSGQSHGSRASLSVPSSPLTGASASSGYALAPAAVIRASPSSPASLNITSLTGVLSDRSRSPSASPSGTRSRQPSPLSTRGDGINRPGTAPAATQSSVASRPYVGPGSTSFGSQSHTSSAVLEEQRQISGHDQGQRRPSQSSTSSIASRKASSSSLRGAVEQAPPMPEGSSAVIENVPLLQPPPRSQSAQSRSRSPSPSPAPSQAPSQVNAAIHPNTESNDGLILVPHQPELNTSLSSFNPRKVSPTPSLSSAQHPPTGIFAMPRQISDKSLHAEAVPLPESPQLQAASFEAQQALPRSDTNLTVAPNLKPRASSPNLRTSSANTDVKSKSAHVRNGLPAKINKATPPPRKSSKSPFSLFKRSRSKTLGEEATPNSMQVQSQASPPAMPSQFPPLSSSRKESLASPSAVISSEVIASQPTSAQMTPAPTPQLSFSSSTTSTMAGSEPCDQFYADFSPASRPSFSTNSSANDPNAKSPNAKQTPSKASSSTGTDRVKQPTASSANATKVSIRRIFGASTRRNV